MILETIESDIHTVESVNYSDYYCRVRVLGNLFKGENQVKFAVRILLIAGAGCLFGISTATALDWMQCSTI